MGRGIARKAKLTKKCCCDNPNWHYDDIEVNENTKEITYKLRCTNCFANWGTKSTEVRKYWFPIYNKVPSVWCGYGYNGNKTVKELFSVLDSEREENLLKDMMLAENKLLEAEKEAEKRRKVFEKFKKQIKEIGEMLNEEF